jgi:hypothetical protein
MVSTEEITMRIASNEMGDLEDRVTGRGAPAGAVPRGRVPSIAAAADAAERATTPTRSARGAGGHR